VHRRVGVLDERLEIHPVIREEAHSDRAADEQLAGFVLQRYRACRGTELIKERPIQFLYA
jgi:hypothetical protein